MGLFIGQLGCRWISKINIDNSLIYDGCKSSECVSGSLGRRGFAFCGARQVLVILFIFADIAAFGTRVGVVVDLG